MCAHSKPDNSPLRAGESHFEGSAAATFGTGFAMSARMPALGPEGQVVFGHDYPSCRQGLEGTTQPWDRRPAPAASAGQAAQPDK